MEQYAVKGMSCAACSARVERAVLEVEGVTSCSVSLLTNSMTVEGDAGAESIIAAVSRAGYEALPKSMASAEKSESESDKESRTLQKRLVFSFVILAILMYLSMGHLMLGLWIPAFLSGSPIMLGVLQMLLALAVMIINKRFFINGARGALHGAPNMDTLVALGSAASFGYSIYVLVLAALADESHAYLHDLYFESAAMILALITLGKLLEARAKGRTTNALKSLMSLTPKTATLVRDGKETVVAVEDIRLDDIFAVRPGESIPTDGVVIEGQSAVDESALSGESIPVDKTVGSLVSAGTINRSGYIRCRASSVGEDTTLAKIIKMVSDAAATKAPIAKVADRVSGIFVPVIIAISLGVLAIWLALGESIGFALTRAVSVLVISCPCALGLATPVAIMVGSGKGARCGILFKNATSLEMAGRVRAVALDKTGTITKGEPEVSDIIGDGELLRVAYSLEIKSEHPLARAIVKRAEEDGVSAIETEGFEIFPGGGLGAYVDGEYAVGGSAELVEAYANIDEQTVERAKELAKEGKTATFFAKGGRMLGVIALADRIKEDSRAAIKELRDMGIRVVMLTGDGRATAEAIGREVGIDEIMSEQKPEAKERNVRELKRDARVAMVGDGINDAPSLTSADLGIAIGAGTDVAIDAADVVLVNSRLSDVCAAVRLGRATLRTVRQNLFWAFVYNIICIPVAAGAFAWAGVTLSPMLGAAAMSLSSFCVVTNALRLNFYKVKHEESESLKDEKKEMEKKVMEKVIKIEGMMCMHCEARVKKVLEETEGVMMADVSHKEGRATVSVAGVSNEILTKVITDNGYKVTEITER